LERERRIPAGRSARDDSRVSLGNQSELTLEVRNEFGQKCVRVRPVVRRIHAVGRVEIRCRMLKRDNHGTREIVANPVLMKFEARLRIPEESASTLRIGLRNRLRRVTEWRIQIEMTLDVDRRVTRGGAVI